MATRIKRNVYLYTTRLLNGDGEPVTTPLQLWKDLRALPYSVPNGECRARALDQDGDYVIAVEVRAVRSGRTPARVFGRIFKTRFTDFPLEGKADADAPLQLADDSKGLRDVAHFVWWDVSQLGSQQDVPLSRCEGLLAMEFNHLAPRAESLANHIYLILGGKRELDISPLLNEGVWDQIAADGLSIRRLKVRVPVDFGHIADGDHLGMLTAPDAEELMNLQEIEILLKPAPRGKLSLSQAFFDRVKAVFTRPDLEKTGVTGKVKLADGTDVDLDSWKVKREVRAEKTGNTNSVDSQSVWKGIRDVVEGDSERVGQLMGRVWP